MVVFSLHFSPLFCPKLWSHSLEFYIKVLLGAHIYNLLKYLQFFIPNLLWVTNGACKTALVFGERYKLHTQGSHA
jgi:hypothetical protein